MILHAMILGLVLVASPGPAPSPLGPMPDAVAEAAFRSLLERPVGIEGDTLCLEVDGMDPTTILPALADASAFPLVAGSECHYERTPDRRVRALTRGGEPATFVSLSSFERTAETEVTVDYEVRRGSWTGYGSALTLVFADGAWQVQPHGGYEWVE